MCCLIWMWFMLPWHNYNSSIKNHWWQITITNIIVMEKLEILWELPKHDTEIWNEQMLLEKRDLQTLLMQGCHKPSICKKRALQSAIKQNTIKQRMAIWKLVTFFSYSKIAEKNLVIWFVIVQHKKKCFGVWHHYTFYFSFAFACFVFIRQEFCQLDLMAIPMSY